MFILWLKDDGRSNINYWIKKVADDVYLLFTHVNN